MGIDIYNAIVAAAKRGVYVRVVAVRTTSSSLLKLNRLDCQQPELDAVSAERRKQHESSD